MNKLRQAIVDIHNRLDSACELTNTLPDLIDEYLASRREITVHMTREDLDWDSLRPLKPGDRIVTAWAETCAGPGWANWIVWVLVQPAAGGYRMECIQPDDQSPEVQDLFDFSALASKRMLRAVARNYESPPQRIPTVPLDESPLPIEEETP